MSEAEKISSASPSIWVLASPGAGDNAQLRTLAGMLSPDAGWHSRVDPISRVIAGRLGRVRCARAEDRWLDAGHYSPPWPDLILLAGGRHAINAYRIRAASGGRSRIVCLGRPWAPLDWFDLVVTTPQYRLPDGPNVLTLDLPLNAPPGESAQARAYWQPELDRLPGPVLGLLLGGSSGSFRLTRRCERRIADRVGEIASARGAGVAVVDSPRSPAGLAERVGARLDVPVCVCTAAGDAAPNPYAVVIRAADALIVTEDSVSMIADSIHSGKPTAVLDLQPRVHSRISRGIRRTMPALDRLGRGLVRRGWWCPPRDVRALRNRLLAAGLISESADVLTAHGPRYDPLQHGRSQVLARIAELLEPADAGPSRDCARR